MAEKGMLNHCKWPAIELAEGVLPLTYRTQRRPESCPGVVCHARC